MHAHKPLVGALALWVPGVNAQMPRAYLESYLTPQDAEQCAWSITKQHCHVVATVTFPAACPGTQPTEGSIGTKRRQGTSTLCQSSEPKQKENRETVHTELLEHVWLTGSDEDGSHVQEQQQASADPGGVGG